MSAGSAPHDYRVTTRTPAGGANTNAEASTGTLVLNDVSRIRRCTPLCSVTSNWRIVASASSIQTDAAVKGAPPSAFGMRL